MTNRRRTIPAAGLCVLAAALLLLIAQPAYAYADPGSGILLWQLLLAGVSGALFYLRRLLRGRRADKKPDEPPPSS